MGILSLANSYCSYLNNLCRNIVEAEWEGATPTNAFTVLGENASGINSETGFILNLAVPLSGPYGRQNDTTSAVKHFFHFIREQR